MSDDLNQRTLSEACHCGETVIIHEDGFTWHLCFYCDSVRCDAYPSACVADTQGIYGEQAARRFIMEGR